MRPPRNPHAKDAEAAGAYVRIALRGKWEPDAVYWLAKWAGHWGNLALAQNLAHEPRAERPAGTGEQAHAEPDRALVDGKA